MNKPGKRPTYPISRLLTHPLTTAAGMTVPGAYLGTSILPGIGTLIGGLSGAALGYLGGAAKRWLYATALASRSLSPETLMAAERSAIRKILNRKYASLQAKDRPYLLSEAFTSRVTGGLGSGGLAALLASSSPAAMAAFGTAGAAAGAGGEAIGRILFARALKGRLERGGRGLTDMERHAVDMIRKSHRAKQIIKGLIATGGAAGLLAAAAYAAKKLSDKEKRAAS